MQDILVTDMLGELALLDTHRIVWLSAGALLRLTHILEEGYLLALSLPQLISCPALSYFEKPDSTAQESESTVDSH